MSRCFPFPPPGYERKQRPEDLEILKEAKRKEKKHKKEKKDKAKTEGKVKKEKDRSDDKNKVKKDRKRKHKDKKDKEKDTAKEKEKEKEREKSSISEEATVAGKLEVNNGEKVSTKGGYNKEWNPSVSEGKRAPHFEGQNGELSIQKSILSWGIEESKFVQELDRRIRDDEYASVLEKEDRGKNKDKRVDNTKMGVQGFCNVFGGNAISENLAEMCKITPRPVEQNVKILPRKDKSMEKGDGNRDEMQMDRSRDKNGRKIGKEKERETKKEKNRSKTETKENMQERSKGVGRNEVDSVTSYKSMHILEGIDRTSLNDGNLRKRKDLDSHDFLHDSELKRNKLQKLTPHQLTENGRKLESARIHCISTLDKHEIANNIRVDSKDRKANGTIEAQKLSSIKPKPSDGSMFDDDQIVEASTKPPHPDTKYLSEILEVPKFEWPEDDDQEWLFTQKETHSKGRSAVGNEEMHVWAHAVHLESADISALPYVIPY